MKYILALTAASAIAIGSSSAMAAPYQDRTMLSQDQVMAPELVTWKSTAQQFNAPTYQPAPYHRGYDAYGYAPRGHFADTPSPYYYFNQTYGSPDRW